MNPKTLIEQFLSEEGITKGFQKAVETYREESLKLDKLRDEQNKLVDKFKKASPDEKEKLKPQLIKMHKAVRKQSDIVDDAERKFNKALDLEPVELDETLTERAEQGDYVQYYDVENGKKYPWYIIYIDSTHVELSNKEPKPDDRPSGFATYHIRQLNHKPWYNDMVKWMKTGDKKHIEGKKYPVKESVTEQKKIGINDEDAYSFWSDKYKEVVGRRPRMSVKELETWANSNFTIKGSKYVLKEYVTEKKYIEGEWVAIDPKTAKIIKRFKSGRAAMMWQKKQADDSHVMAYSEWKRTYGPYIKELNESKDPQVIDDIRDIVKKESYGNVKDPDTGRKVKMDLFTASAIIKVYDALSPANKRKFTKLSVPKMANMAFKIIK